MSSDDLGECEDRRRRFVVLLLATLALAFVVLSGRPLLGGNGLANDDTAVLGRQESREDPRIMLNGGPNPGQGGRRTAEPDGMRTVDLDPQRQP
ncbi:MAG: hypothetical protein WD010_09075 [Nitriliruptor sp.]